MSAIKVRKTYTYTIERKGTDQEFEVEYEPLEFMDAEFEDLPDGHVLVGYYSDDPDVGNPLDDCDGLGHIYRWSQRDATREERLKFFEAIGYNEHGDRDPLLKPAKHFVMLDKYDHSGVSWTPAGEGMNDRWDTSRNNGVWVPDESVLDHIKDAAIVRWFEETQKIKIEYTRPNGLKAILPGNIDTPSFSSYKQLGKHLAKHYNVKITPEIRKKGERLAAVHEAREACELYTAWLGGQCYACNAEVFDAEGNKVGETEETGGAVGEDHARDVLTDIMGNAKSAFEASRKRRADSGTPADDQAGGD